MKPFLPKPGLVTRQNEQRQSVETNVCRHIRLADRTAVRASDVTAALSKTGRQVTLDILANWRRRGFLPALDSKGLGRGRDFYWTDKQLIERAMYVFDAIAENRSADEVLMGLWFQNFDVRTSLFRRCWHKWVRAQKLRKTDRTSTADAIAASPCMGVSFEIFLMRTLSNGLAPSPRFPHFEGAIKRIARNLFAEPHSLNAESLLFLRGLLQAFENSDRLESAPGEILKRAQEYVAEFLTAAKFSMPRGDAADAWTAYSAVQIGAPFLGIVLSLIYSGHRKRLAVSLEALRELNHTPTLDGPRLSDLRGRLIDIWSPLLNAAPKQNSAPVKRLAGQLPVFLLCAQNFVDQAWVLSAF